jgi:hypothetical protein
VCTHAIYAWICSIEMLYTLYIIYKVLKGYKANIKYYFGGDKGVIIKIENCYRIKF